MAAFPELIDLLERALADRVGRRELIDRFEDLVWADKELIGASAQTDDLLRDLAHDLSYFEPDPVARAECSAYFGDDALEHLIRSAIGKLRP